MNITKKRAKMSRWIAPLCLSITLTISGCAEIIVIAVWAGKVMLYTAAARVTIHVVDRLLGQEKEADFVIDPSDPNRGRFKSLVFKPDNRAREVVLVDVPAYKGSDGQWHIDEDYRPKVDAALKKARGH